MIVEPPFAYLGSKRRMIPFILDNIPPSWDKEKNKYIQPFMGSGVVALNIPFTNAILSDIEEPMITFYSYLKKYCKDDELLELLKGKVKQCFQIDKISHFDTVKNNIASEKSISTFLAQYIYLRKRATMGRCYFNFKKNGYVSQFRKDQIQLDVEAVWNKVEVIQKTLETKNISFYICEFIETLKNAKN